MKKNISILKIIMSSVLCIAGVLTIVFAILALAGVQGGMEPKDTLRYIVGSALCICGAVMLTISCAKNPHTLDLINVLIGAGLIALGVFLFLSEAESVITILISLIFPMILSCFGIALLLKGLFIVLTNKRLEVDAKRNKFRGFWVIFTGALVTVLGILFCVFRGKPQIVNINWIIVGLVIAIYAFMTLIQSIKEIKKNDTKKEDKPQIEQK